MASIPLPALGVQPPPNPLDQYSKVLQMKSLLQNQQLQQEQITGASQENEMRALQLADSKTIQQIAPKYVQKDDSGKVTGYDFDGLTDGAIAAGVRPQSLAPLQAMRKNAADTLLAQEQAKKGALENQNTINDQITGHLEAFRNAPPEMKQTELNNAMATAKKYNMPWQLPTDAAQITPQMLETAETSLAMHSQHVKEAQELAATAKDTAQSLLDQNKADMIANYRKNPQLLLSQVDSIVNPKMPLNSRTKFAVQQSLAAGDVDGAKEAIKAAAQEVGAIERETNPAVQAAKLHLATAEKAAEQAIADGDPRAAAQLLVSGTVAPSQLISSRKPAFAQQAFTAAAQMQPGWSATKADADYKVASSPANVAFFGSAKSLTDKGGTLDQLADAAKDIPANQIPVFNTVADALRASTGSGPIAKYAAIALGVADDYSKVMGGGQGSDTSRTQALNLISAKQSPEQRAASIEGIRGSVSSQINSRMGSNPVLQKMYGGIVSPEKTKPAASAPPAGATHTAVGSDGKRHYTNAQGQDLGVAP
jgi:hypothetical protein